jgi:hypothetical protein
MMATITKKKSPSHKRKKIRYRKVEFKITDQQKKLITRYCRKNRTSPVRLIKKALLEYLERHVADLPEEETVSKNQLKLFDHHDDHHTGKQTSLFN